MRLPEGLVVALEGSVHLVRAAAAIRAGRLTTDYPQFAGVEFPQATTETKQP